MSILNQYPQARQRLINSLLSIPLLEIVAEYLPTA